MANGETKAEKRRRKQNENLLETQENFANIAAALTGLAAQLEAQGFTSEQAREIVTATYVQAIRMP